MQFSYLIEAAKTFVLGAIKVSRAGSGWLILAF